METIEKFRRQGIGTGICKLLVDLSLKTDPAVRITARTLPEKNFFQIYRNCLGPRGWRGLGMVIQID
jgi:hypothetical protein